MFVFLRGTTWKKLKVNTHHFNIQWKAISPLTWYKHTRIYLYICFSGSSRSISSIMCLFEFFQAAMAEHIRRFFQFHAPISLKIYKRKIIKENEEMRKIFLAWVGSFLCERKEKLNKKKKNKIRFAIVCVAISIDRQWICFFSAIFIVDLLLKDSFAQRKASHDS